MQIARLLILLTLAPAIPLCAQPAAIAPAPSRAAQPAAASANFLVTILPVQVAGAGTPAWLGRSVHQSLQSEVAASGYRLYDKASPLLAAQTPQSDPGVLVDVVCRGQGTDLSIQATLVDLATQSPIGLIRVDGATRDFLALKDQARAQLRELLNQRRDTLRAAVTPLMAQQPAQPRTPAQPLPDLNLTPPGTAFDSSSLSQSVNNPAAFQQQYQDLYNQQPYRGSYRRFNYYPPAYLGYPYGYYGGGTIVRRSQSSSTGLTIDFGYQDSHLRVKGRVGAGQTSSNDTTTIGAP